MGRLFHELDMPDVPAGPETPAKSTKCPATGRFYRGATCPMCQVAHEPAPAPLPEDDDEPDDVEDDDAGEDEEEPDVATAKTKCDEGHPLRGWNRVEREDGAIDCRRCALAAGKARAKKARGNGSTPKAAPPPKARRAGNGVASGPIATTLAALREERETVAARLAKLDQVIAQLEEIA